jgi:hypothetical protein
LKITFEGRAHGSALFLYFKKEITTSFFFAIIIINVVTTDGQKIKKDKYVTVNRFI